MNRILANQKVQKRRRHNSSGIFLKEPDRIQVGRISNFLRNRIKPSLVVGAFLLSALLIIPLYPRLSNLILTRSNTEEVAADRVAGVIPNSTKNEGIEIESSNEVSPLGSGITELNREVDITHAVAQGEALSEIAYIYKIDLQKLAFYNKITDPNTIQVGNTIRIPSYENEKSINSEAARNYIESSFKPAGRVVSTKTYANPDLTIVSNQSYDGTSVTAHFTIENPSNQELTNLEWDLGNRRKSFRSSTYWTYDAPGTYRVTLKARNSSGRLLTSNPIFVDVPHPATYKDDYHRFITLNSIDETFSFDGNLVDVLNYKRVEESPIQQKVIMGSTLYQAEKPGFYNLKVEKDRLTWNYYLFVSPIESRHSDRTDLNWYRTQFNTGALSNCGPTVISMGVAWSTGEYIPVAKVRQQIGWTGNGGTSFNELVNTLKKNKVDARFTPVNGPKDLFNIIDNGNIAIILYKSGAVRRATGDLLQNLFGRYYSDSVGHYVIVKGYSTDGKYLIVYDPIPSDWGSNTMRYADGISMMGRNRYYPVGDIFGALRRNDVIEIRR